MTFTTSRIPGENGIMEARIKKVEQDRRYINKIKHNKEYKTENSNHLPNTKSRTKWRLTCNQKKRKL